MLSGSKDKTIRLWNLKTGQCVHVLKGHSDEVLCVCASPGAQVLSASADRTVRLWFLDWELEDRELTDWDESARPYLQNFLTLHSPGRSWRGRWKRPDWSGDDFSQLLSTLSFAGYGWLRPEGIRRELEEMAADWKGPPPLPRAGE